MEEKTTLEQPLNLQNETNDNVQEQINNNLGQEETNLQDGSNYGKFKDATSLLNAYNNLEKEFTKKSQKLAELIKEHSSSQSIINTPEEKVAPIPFFKQKDWQNEVSKFFNENPEAKAFAKEIASTLINDRDIANSKNCLKYAYALAELKNKVKPAELLNDSKYLEDIYSNENIKNKIISKYLQDVKQNKNNLMFISGEANSISPTRPNNKPKNLKEASNILKKLLQS